MKVWKCDNRLKFVRCPNKKIKDNTINIKQVAETLQMIRELRRYNITQETHAPSQDSQAIGPIDIYLENLLFCANT